MESQMAIPKNVARRKTFRSSDFFATEIYFYEKVWPLMESFKTNKKVLDLDLEVPRLLSSFSDGEHDFIALEDLSYKGYKTAEREGSVNFDQTKLGLILMAKFHALSIALRDQKPEFDNVASDIQESYFSEKFRPWYTGFLEEKLKKIIRNAVTTELPEYYLEKINKLFETDLYGVACSYTSVRNKCTAVTQGDAWIPNFLFKYDDKGNAINAVMIDFQLARYTTLSNDVSFFLYVCMSEDMLETHWDELIEIYYKELSKRIEELGSEKNLITFDELKEDLSKHAIFGFIMGMEAKTMSFLEENEVADLDEIQGEEAVPLHSIWDIPPFKDITRNKRLAKMVKHFIDKGYINDYIN
ncbi:uncharacterized protein LOC109594553 isoform X2 [Aethina tumida]|uniref:uncharacterized protein LOC109594553 isoform X2 n=1 Tax=Aethina tumida TaxID=116153 RepID=UPI00214784C3|nr:uncharacterized protein LOC109594553 isoform X2 [Aethina tumida]